MAARWMDDGGRQNDEDPPRLGRRAARRARAARVEDMTEEDEEYVAALDDVFTDAEFERLFGDVDLSDVESEAGRALPPPAPRPREPAAARLDRRDSVARAAASLHRADRPAERVRRANSELRRLHALRDPQAHSRDEAQDRHQALSRAMDRWVDDFVGVPMFYQQRARCDICLLKKRLADFLLANCGHGCCRDCVKSMQDAGRKECAFCRSHVDTYCEAEDWPHDAHLDRLLASQAAMNPYTI